jgi:alanine racemase
MMKPVALAEIDLGAIAHNVRALKSLTASDVRMMAVVKADGYGHGAVAVSRTALENGACELAVARISEAVTLREAGIDSPVLIFGYVFPEMAEELIELNLRASIHSLPLAEALSHEAGRIRKKLKVHLKIDTGMGRLGLLPGNKVLNDDCCIGKVRKIAALPWLELEGIYTHFANADMADKTHAREQLFKFLEILGALKAKGIDFPLRHAANSAALIEMPESHLNMVRPGISIYGCYPGPEVDRSLVELRPAMTLKSGIVQVKEVPRGFPVSYGSTFITEKPSRIATVSIGYADGYNRLLSSRGFMLVRGERAPVVGRVCMDLTLIDVTHIENVQIGDEAVLFGRQGEVALHVDEMADLIGTISYELISGISSRIPRIYH